MTPLAVAATLAAGGLGALARYALGVAVARRSQPDARTGLPGRLPWAVLVVNAAGSAIGGGVLALAQGGILDPSLRTVLLTGLCGGLTTFSTFSVETVQLARGARPRAAVANVAVNVGVGLALAAGAWALVAAVLASAGA